MTLAETGKILSAISLYYPSFQSGRGIQETARAWHLIFADDAYKAVEAALLAYVSTDVKGFPPMPGALKALMVQRPDRMSALEAWHKVRKAVQNGWYGSAEEFAKLPPICQRIVGSPSTLKDWATMDLGELDTVVGSNFQRSYTQIENDEAYYAKLPGAVLQALPGIEKLGLMPGEDAS